MLLQLPNKEVVLETDLLEKKLEKLEEQQKQSNEAVVIIKDYLLDRQEQIDKKEKEEQEQLKEIEQKEKQELVAQAKIEAKEKKEQKQFETQVLQAISDVTPPEQDMTVFEDLKTEIIKLQEIESETTLADTSLIFAVVIIVPLVTIYFIFNKIMKPFIN